MRNLLAVELALLRVELAVNVRDLAHEERPDVRSRPVELTAAGHQLRGLSHTLRDERIRFVDPGDSHGWSSSELSVVGSNPGAIASSSDTHSSTVRAIGPT